MDVEGVGGDGHPLDELVRVVVKDVTILEGARFGLVTVAGDVVRLAVIMPDESPLHSAGETCTTATTEVGLLDLINNLFGLHPESFLELGVATVLYVAINVGGVTLGPGILEDNAALLGMRRK
jgi:hypothetical protein